MRKGEVLEMFGSVRAVAEAVGISTQAVSQWPDELPPRIADRVVAAIARARGKQKPGPKAKPRKKAA